MKKWPKEIVDGARKMRQEGSTYGEIKKRFPVAKSTLSLWLRDLPNSNHLAFTNRGEWLKKIRLVSSRIKKRTRMLKEKRIAETVRDEVSSWGFLNLKGVQKTILAMLYWAEGQKLPELSTCVKFVNTDPRMILLFITLLRNCYDIDESKLRIRLHVHWYHNIRRTRKFWSGLLGVNESQFGKIYVKPRSKTKKFRRNFAGICFVIYYSVDLRREIVGTGYNVGKAIAGEVPFLRS